MVEVLEHKVIGYNSVEVTDACTTSGVGGASRDSSDSSRKSPMSLVDFEQRLWHSLRLWKKDGRKGVWLKLGVGAADLVPVAVRAGFVFHRAEPDSVTMTAWLPVDKSANRLPPGPSHFIGVAGFVLNARGEVLCIREKSGPSARLKGFWKLPGGLVDKHEDLRDAVVREVKEETGIDAVFKELVTVQEIHHSEAFGGAARAGTTDLYCICVLQLTSEGQTIVPQPEEIAACKWVPLQELLDSRYYNKEGTVYHAMFRAAASAAQKTSAANSSGLQAEHLDFGLVPGSNTLYFPAGKL